MRHETETLSQEEVIAILSDPAKVRGLFVPTEKVVEDVDLDSACAISAGLAELFGLTEGSIVPRIRQSLLRRDRRKT